MSPITKDAERAPKPRLPKRRVLKKAKKSKRSHSGGKKTKSKHRGKSRGVMSCPKCGSTNLFWASGLPHLWSVWECRSCGHRGTFIVRGGKLAEKVREDYTKTTVKH